MSRPVVCPLTVGATGPESLSVLQRRLHAAEQQTEELVRSLGSSGARTAELKSSAGRTSDCPVSAVQIHQACSAGGDGLLWKQWEALIARVCRLESLLHTLKLTTFRLETGRELDPCHAARLQEQLSALQGQYEEDQRSSRREVLNLQDQLQQACEERNEAQREVLRLREALKNVKGSQMRKQMSKENGARLEANQSHNALLLRVKEMERVEEQERKQVEMLQADCYALRADGLANRAELKKRDGQIQNLEKECQQLRDQSSVKESLILELTTELKSVKVALQKQQQENSRLIRDGRDLRAATDQIQMLNNKLEAQCSELQTLTLKNTRLQTENQNNIKAERDRMSKHLKEQELLLDTARRNIQAELQGVILEKLTLQKKLEVLQSDLAKLQQSSAAAEKTAVTHQQMLEQTIERLQGELSCAVRQEQTMRKDRDEIKSEMNTAIILLEQEKTVLETQLSEIEVQLATVNSALQKQEEENRELMESLAAMKHQQITHQQVEQMLWELTDSKNKLAYEKGKLQARVQQMGDDLKMLKAECSQHSQTNTALQNNNTKTQRENQVLKEQLNILQQQHRDTHEVTQTLEDVLSSHARLLQKTDTLHAELGERAQEMHTLRRERLEARKEIKMLKAEVENLQATHTTNKEQIEALQKALDEAQLDNRKLAQSLEQISLENHSAQEKPIRRLAEHVDSLKGQLKREKDSRRKSAQRLKKALDNASMKSDDLSQANQKLQEKVSELEKQVSVQKSQIQAQKDIRTALNNSLRIKDLEAEIESLEEAKSEYKKRSYEQSQSLLQLHAEMTSLQTELQCLTSTQQGELQAERDLNRTLQEKCRHLEESLRRLQDERDEAEVRLRKVCLEYQQITENMDEDHRGFCSISESFNDDENGEEPQEVRENSWRTGKERTLSTAEDKSKAHICSFDPELEPWASTLQRWEIKNELTDITNAYKPMK